MILDLPEAARYNHWANARLYNALLRLSDDDRKKDRRGFFRSIHGTMNHILLVDLLYRGRLEDGTNRFRRLDEILHQNFVQLKAAHRASDAWYLDFHSRYDRAELDQPWRFRPVGMDEGEEYTRSFRECFANLFQHQIHHRGQVHHMITHAGAAAPPLDFIMFCRGAEDEWSGDDRA